MRCLLLSLLPDIDHWAHHTYNSVWYVSNKMPNTEVSISSEELENNSTVSTTIDCPVDRAMIWFKRQFWADHRRRMKKSRQRHVLSSLGRPRRTTAWQLVGSKVTHGTHTNSAIVARAEENQRQQRKTKERRITNWKKKQKRQRRQLNECEIAVYLCSTHI